VIESVEPIGPGAIMRFSEEAPMTIETPIMRAIRAITASKTALLNERLFLAFSFECSKALILLKFL
jgi:hypothetical protein